VVAVILAHETAELAAQVAEAVYQVLQVQEEQVLLVKAMQAGHRQQYHLLSAVVEEEELVHLVLLVLDHPVAQAVLVFNRA